jgi:hypothetical protein
MNSVGGYFELELRKGQEYHKEALRLNTGRNALELVLLERRYSKLLIPYFTCDAILEPLEKVGIDYEFYSIDKALEPTFDCSQLETNEGFLYINYFGLKDSYVARLAKKCNNLIIDNSQAFFSLPERGVDTFYSARKFFGVPDGSYLYTKVFDVSKLPFDVSLDRLLHLVTRIEYSAEAGYKEFVKNDQSLIGQPIRQMSRLTKALLSSIDYEFAKQRRRENFSFLHQHLAKYNKMEWTIGKDSVPMVYPLLTDKGDLRATLIEHRVYTAQYWPSVLELVGNDKIEYHLTQNVISLPIDHRYDRNDMVTILAILEENL